MKRISLILVAAIVMSLVISAQSVEQRLISYAESVSGDKFPIVGKTQKGAKVYSIKAPSKIMKNAIDRGLTDLFAVARKNQYYQHLNYSDYTVFIAKADRQTDSAGNYIPNFAIPVQQYAGTDYDKGGYMYVAGMVIARNPAAFMIAENDKKPEQVAEVVRYEGEHLILWYNDRKRYDQTADHSKGGGHPILN